MVGDVPLELRVALNQGDQALQQLVGQSQTGECDRYLYGDLFTRIGLAHLYFIQG